jgi:hypothetical protein
VGGDEHVTFAPKTLESQRHFSVIPSFSVEKKERKNSNVSSAFRGRPLS